MDSPKNSRPLLQTNSDSEDVNEDAATQVRQRNVDKAGGSGISRQYDTSESDSNDNDAREVESTTDECDDDLTNLFKPINLIPSDKFSINYMIFYLLGMTTLLPWNFFITAEDVSNFPSFEIPYSFILMWANAEILFIDPDVTSEIGNH